LLTHRNSGEKELFHGNDAVAQIPKTTANQIRAKNFVKLSPLMNNNISKRDEKTPFTRGHDFEGFNAK
jgi:ribosomal protein L31E